MDIKDDVVELSNAVFLFHNKLGEATLGFKDLLIFQHKVGALSDLSKQFNLLFYKRKELRPQPLPQPNIFDGIYVHIKNSMNKVVNFCEKYNIGSKSPSPEPSWFDRMEILAEWLSLVKSLDNFLIEIGYRKG